MPTPPPESSPPGIVFKVTIPARMLPMLEQIREGCRLSSIADLIQRQLRGMFGMQFPDLVVKVERLDEP